MDMITSLCFARSVNAMAAPDFNAPIVEAMEATIPTARVFVHFPWVKVVVMRLPPWLIMRVSPTMTGLLQLRRRLGAQIEEVCNRSELLEKAPHPITYTTLLDPARHKGKSVPSAVSLFGEAESLLFAGSETVGNILMIGVFHMLKVPRIALKLKEELLAAWPLLNQQPKLENLERLPYLVIPSHLQLTNEVLADVFLDCCDQIIFEDEPRSSIAFTESCSSIRR